jgi:hypothetical protein
MWFLTGTENHGLVEANTFRMVEAEHAQPVKLAGQQARTRIKSCCRNHENQHSISTNPAIAMVEEYEFHSLIAVRPQFCVVWRVEVQKRTGFRLDLALKCAAMDGRNSSLSGCSGTVGINLNCRQMRPGAIRNLQKCAAVAGTRVYSTVGS